MQIPLDTNNEDLAIKLEALTRKIQRREFPQDRPTESEISELMYLSSNLSFNVKSSFEAVRGSKLVNN